MNDIDGHISLKQLYIKYRMDSIKVKNLEFRIRDDVTYKGITEIPIVIQDDNEDSSKNGHNPIKLRMIENQWKREEKITNIPSNKRKRQPTPKKVKDKTTPIRVGTDELLHEMIEIKKLLLNLREDNGEKSEMVTFDKIDQIREVERSIFDEETKDTMIQIILSRQDGNDIKYKLLEEELLTGKNYMIQMPKIQNIRNNILGMVQVIEEMKTDKWDDKSLTNRLQIVTGNRMKQLIEHQLKNIVTTLTNFKKEMDIVNEYKSMCETKDSFDLVKFKDMLRELIETKEYENVKYDFLERWCIEIENCLQYGMKKKDNNDGDTEKAEKEEKCYGKAITEGNECKRGRFTLSSDSESEGNSIEVIQPTRKTTNQMSEKREIINILSATDEDKSEETEEIEYIQFSSSEDEE